MMWIFFLLLQVKYKPEGWISFDYIYLGANQYQKEIKAGRMSVGTGFPGIGIGTSICEAFIDSCQKFLFLPVNLYLSLFGKTFKTGQIEFSTFLNLSLCGWATQNLQKPFDTLKTGRANLSIRFCKGIISGELSAGAEFTKEKISPFLSAGIMLGEIRSLKIKKYTPELYAEIYAKKKILEAGEYQMLNIEIENRGNLKSESFPLILEGSLLNHAEVSVLKRVKELEPGEAVTIPVRIKIDEDASSGNYTLKVKNVDFCPIYEFKVLSLLDLHGEPGGTPYAQCDLQILPGNYIRAGESILLKLKIKNIGDGTFYGLNAIVKSPSRIFNGLKFEIGRLKPGEEITKSLICEIPETLKSQKISLEIKFTEYNGYYPQDIETEIYVEGLPHPDFTCIYRVKDKPGNGDGIVQPGEGINLYVFVKNIGAGEGRDVKIKIKPKNYKNIEFHTKTEKEIGKIYPQEVKIAKFYFSCKPAYKGKEIPLKIEICDKFWGIKREFNIKLPVKMRPSKIVKVKDFYRTKSRVKVYAGAGDFLPVIAEIDSGQNIVISAKMGEWVKIEEKGLSGWIRKENLEKIKILKEKPKIRYYRIFLKNPPIIAISKPKDSYVKTNKGFYEIYGAVFDDKGIKDVKIFLNKKEVRGMIVKQKKIFGKVYKISEKIKLREGRNYVRIEAEDVEGLKSSYEFVIDRREFSLPTIWAIVIGISNYREKSLRLRAASNDALSFYKLVKSPFIGATPDKIWFLIDKKASRKNIVDAFEKVLKGAGKNDMVICYLALHGIPYANELYFLPYDAETDKIAATGIPSSDIIRLLKLSRAGKIVFFIDACHSGGFIDEIGLKRGLIHYLVSQLIEELALSRRSLAVMSASSAGEVSFEGERWDNHGVFTYYLIKGLRGSADTDRDGFVRLRELYNWVYKRVRNATAGKQNPDLDGDFDNNLPLSIVK